MLSGSFRRKWLQGGVAILITLYAAQGLAAATNANDGAAASPGDSAQAQPSFVFSLDGFGGPMVRFSPVNDELGVLVGGRGAGNVTNHFTLGGGGCGLVNGMHITDASLQKYLVKFGYGGLEVGYIVNPRDVVSVSANLLLAAGTVIREAESGGVPTRFYWFFAVEPALYATAHIFSFMQLNIGVTYRQLAGVHAEGISNKKLSGVAGSVALLIGRKRQTRDAR